MMKIITDSNIELGHQAHENNDEQILSQTPASV
jgi:hypothetical protein